MQVRRKQFVFMAPEGAADAPAAGGLPGSESALTSGQDTTAATGDQTTADTTTTTVDTSTQTTPPADGNPNPAKDGNPNPAKDGNPDPAKDGANEGDPAEGKKDGDKPTGAPEAYEAFTVPEGFELNEQLLSEFTPVLKELNLSQEAAQKLVDFAPKLVEQTVARTQATVLEQLGIAEHATWAAALKADKEIGGDKLPENLGHATKAFKTLFSPAAQKLINGLGLGNHPEVIRGLVNVGKAISEDGFVPGGKTTSSPSAQGMYGKSNMNP